MQIPERILAALIAYRDERSPTGGFLIKVLDNNLMDAVCSADAESYAAIREIVQWCYWELPSDAWGSPEKRIAWLTRG